MKSHSLLIAAIAGLSALASCQREAVSPALRDDVRTTLKVSVCPETKTILGEKSGNNYPNFWQTADKICVNGIVSEPLGEEAQGSKSAVFTFQGAIEAPYCAGYPADAFSNYSNGSAAVTLPASQNYVAGSYDPAAFIMGVKCDSKSNIAFSTLVSILHLRLTGEGAINQLKLTCDDGVALCGSFTTDFSALTPGAISNELTVLAEPAVQLPADFYICLPSGVSGPVDLEITDSNGASLVVGGNISAALQAGKMYSPDAIECAFEKPAGLNASLKSKSSCSAVFTWTFGGEASEDIAKPYTIALYSDAACKNLVVSHNIDAGASFWKDKAPCFSFGGLDPNTTYYFRAAATESSESVSNVVEFTTDEFTIVDATTVSNAAVGDIILGENFGEVAWGPDELEVAAGFVPSSKTNVVPSGENPDGSYVEYNSTNTYVSWANMTEGTRLSHDWGYVKNNSSYFRTGYLRNATSTSGNRMHIVTPTLVGIPEGKLATIEVSVKAARYTNDNDVAVFVESGNLDGNKKFSPDFSNGYPMGISTSKVWETRKITIQNVTDTSRLVIGTYENIDTKNRFFLSDISVKIVDLYDSAKDEIKAKSTSSTSSTLVFGWTEGKGVDADVANAYTIKLYSDAECTNAVRSFDIPAGCQAWKNKELKFVFGGLEPSTIYYFKVFDTTNNIESNPVSAKTDAFTVVQMPAEITEPGIVLAEDFGELQWEFDYPGGAMGFRPKNATNFGDTEVNTGATNADNGYYNGYHREGGGELQYKGYSTAFSTSRLNDWFAEDNIYFHPGYLKLGTAKGGGWLHTPVFTIPEGKKAIVSVTITGGRYSSGQESDWAIGVEDAAHVTPNTSNHTCTSSWMDKENDAYYQLITFTNNNSWATKSISGLEVHRGDRLVFGPKSGASGTKMRFQISDVTVEVLSIVDEAAAGSKKLSIIGDSISTFEGWIPSGNRVYAEYMKGGCLQDWTNTYWGLLCNKYLPGKLAVEKNISWSGSCVAQDTRTDSAYRPAFVTRYGKANEGATYALNSIGSPDIVIIYGGTNDRYNESYGLSDVTSTPSDDDFNAIFAKSNDALSVTSFVEAYVKLINMVHSDCPSAKIINIIGDYVTVQQIASLKKISDHYDFCKYVDFSNGGSSNSNIKKANGVHPSIEGMDYMARKIHSELGAWMLE